MIEVIGVLFLCYVLIGLEAIVPGGILGILGFLGLFVAAYLAQQEFGGWFAPSITFLGGGLGNQRITDRCDVVTRFHLMRSENFIFLTTHPSSSVDLQENSDWLTRFKLPKVDQLL